MNQLTRFFGFATLSALVVLSGCAARSVAPVVPPGTPTAQVNDRVTSDEDGANSRAFVVLAIDGVAVKNALQHSGRVGFGAGAGITPFLVAREVEARTQSFRVAGGYMHRAPIDGLIRSARGTNQRVEGVITFTPMAGRTYRVTGELALPQPALWIEDFDTKEIVSEKVVGLP